MEENNTSIIEGIKTSRTDMLYSTKFETKRFIDNFWRKRTIPGRFLNLTVFLPFWLIYFWCIVSSWLLLPFAPILYFMLYVMVFTIASPILIIEFISGKLKKTKWY